MDPPTDPEAFTCVGERQPLQGVRSAEASVVSLKLSWAQKMGQHHIHWIGYDRIYI